MTEQNEMASKDDLIRSASIPGYGIVVGVGALLKNQIKRGLTMMAISSAVLFVVVMVARSGILIKAMQGFGLGPATVESELANVARTISLNCPKMVDKNTRLDSAVAGPGRQLTFYYTFPAVISSNVPPQVFSEKIAATNLHLACNAKELKPFFKNNVTVIYSYSAKDGVNLGTVKINRETCGLEQ